jgi:hypothetical protein
MKSHVDRFTLQAKLDWLTWQYYTGGADQASLEAEIAQTREAMHRLLQDMPLDGDGPSELRAEMALAKIETEPYVSRLRGIFQYDDGDLAPETAAHCLLELCGLRNRHARTQGYASYPQLALQAQGLSDSGDTSYGSVLRYLRQPAVRDIAELPEIPCMEQYWDVLEEQFGPTPHGAHTPDDYRQLLQSLLEALGLSDAAEHLEIVVREQPYAAGVAFDLTQGDSRRVGILIRPAGVRAFFTAAHELGHALLYLHRSSARSALPAWLDEGYAHLIEDDERSIRAALQHLCADERIATWLTVHRRLRRIDHDRIWASILTEDALWACVDRADLTDEGKIATITDQCAGFYRQHVGTTYADPLKWALDSFRSIDPVYVHAYALAQNFAALMLEESADMPARYDTSREAIMAITARLAKKVQSGEGKS